MTSLHCNLIHEGLDIKFPKWNDPYAVEYRYCCIAEESAMRSANVYDIDVWNSEHLQSTRELNKRNVWNKACDRCRIAEEAGNFSDSHRLINANVDRKPRTDVSGPSDITIKLSSVCNLMCTTCGPEYSTMWQQAVKKDPPEFIFNPQQHYTNKQEADMHNVSYFFNNMDLSNLHTINFTGGETLLNYEGNLNFKFLEYVATRQPLNKISVLLHTNGTQQIPPRILELLNDCQHVFLSISVDCIGNKFNYLRAPADWNKVEDNILSNLKTVNIKNIKLLIHQVISILTLYYIDDVKIWCKTHGFKYDDHTAGGEYALEQLSDKYIDALTDEQKLHLPKQYKPEEIPRMIQYLDWYDNVRNLNWKKTFPEIAQFYSDYI